MTLGCTNNSGAFGGTIANGTSDTLALVKTGSGLQILSGTNTYSGGTTISGGTLSIGADNNIGNTSGGLTLANGGALLATATFPTARGVTLNSGGGVFAQNAAGTTLTLSGAVGGSGGLTQGGPGMLVLSGTNTYGGGTQLSAGTLNFANVGALGSGTVSFSGNATLQAGTTGMVANSLAIPAGITATLDTQANAVALAGTISGSGGLTQVGAGR